MLSKQNASPMVDHPSRSKTRTLGRRLEQARRSHECYASSWKPSMQAWTTLWRRYTAAWPPMQSAQPSILKAGTSTVNTMFCIRPSLSRNWPGGLGFGAMHLLLTLVHVLKRIAHDGSYSNIARRLFVASFILFTRRMRSMSFL